VADRFYSPDPIVKGCLTLTGNEARHLSRVRRVGVGERVEVFDGRGSAHRAEVREIERNRVELVVLGDPLPDRSTRFKLTLATAVPKGERFDWLVEKATELGVARLVTILTERSVSDPRVTRIDRLRRLIIEASKQCGRNRLMTLETTTAWPTYINEELAEVRLFAHLEGGSAPARWPRLKTGQSVALAIGPEGGFSDEEANAALAAGWQAIRLGPTILRVETAALAGAAALLLMPNDDHA